MGEDPAEILRAQIAADPSLQYRMRVQQSTPMRVGSEGGWAGNHMDMQPQQVAFELRQAIEEGRRQDREDMVNAVREASSAFYQQTDNRFAAENQRETQLYNQPDTFMTQAETAASDAFIERHGGTVWNGNLTDRPY